VVDAVLQALSPVELDV
jgi:hypothetical protein